MSGKAYLISEDGTVFITRAIQNRLKALATPYAGYYLFFPQLVTDILYTCCLVLNSIKFLPHAMRIVSIIIEASIISYFVDDGFENILQQKRDRGVCCLLVALLSLSELVGLYGNITNLQWWIGYFFFLILLRILSNKEFPNFVMTIVLVILGFSTVNVIFFDFVLGILFIFLFKKNYIKRNDVVKLTLIYIPGIVQLISVKSSGRVIGEILDFKKIIEIFPACFNLLGKLAIPNHWTFYNVRVVMIGIIVLTCLFFILWKDCLQFALFSVLYAGGCYAFCVLPIEGNSNNEAIFSGNYLAEGGNVGGRYWFITLLILALVLSVAIMKYLSENRRLISSIFIASYLTFIIIERFEVKTYMDLFGDYTVYYDEGSNYYEKNGMNKYCVQLENCDWYFYIPSK